MSPRPRGHWEDYDVLKAGYAVAEQVRLGPARYFVNPSLNKELGSAHRTSAGQLGSHYSVLRAHIAMSLPSHHPTVQNHHQHYVTRLHCSGCPYLGDDDASCRTVDGSATGLVVFAIPWPPALMELAGQEYFQHV